MALKCRFFFSLLGLSLESVKEVDTSHTSGEKPPVVQRSPKADSYQLKPSTPHASPKRDYRQNSDQAGAVPHLEVKPHVRDAVVSSHILHLSPPLSASNPGATVSLMKASTPPGVSAFSGSPTSASASHVVLSGEDKVPLPSSSADSSRISLPPVRVQGLRSPTSRASETSAQGFKLLPQGHSSSLLQSHSNMTNERMSVGAVSSSHRTSSLSEFLVDQTKPLLPPTTSQPNCGSPPAIVSIASPSSAITSLGMQMVRGSKPVLPSSVTSAFGGPYEIPAPPRLISSALSLSTNSSSPTVAPSKMSAPLLSTLPVPTLSPSAAGSPSPGSTLPEQTSASQYRKPTTPAAQTSLSTAFAASSPPRLVKAPSLPAQTSSPVRPPFTLPLVTTQASRTAPLSNPPALVSMPSPMGTSSRAVENSESEQQPPNSITSSLKPEGHVPSEDKRAVENNRNGTPEEDLSQLDSDLTRTSGVAVVDAKTPEFCPKKSPTDSPGKSLQTSEENLRNASTDLVKSSTISEAVDTPVASTPVGKPLHFKTNRLQHQTIKQTFDNSPETSSYYDDKSSYDTPSKFCVSSILERTSHTGGDGSFAGDSSNFDTSQFDSMSFAEEEQSAPFDSSGEGSLSMDDSREDTMESTRGEETSEAEVTRNGSQVTEGSMLESSFNASPHTEESPAGLSHVTNSSLFGSSQPILQGTFKHVWIWFKSCVFFIIT